ncbi:MAG: polymerase, sigma 28 subunit, FliA/WhiG subfamily [Anaerosporomusa subterranea]|nr:polymerase, sigma 28 subunit, FliA/WhiG subfamily [Anaerosporomusa subterranea]
MLSFFAVLSVFAAKCIQMLVAYVSNNAFPMPLSEKEEQIYLDRLQNGDEQAKAVLVERNLRLVAHIVKKFDNSGEEMDDLISIGRRPMPPAVLKMKF